MTADRATPPPEPVPTHEFLAEEVKARGWTASDVAARCDLSEADVLRVLVLGSYRNPWLVEMPQFARALGVSTDMLTNLIEAEMIANAAWSAWLRDITESGNA